MNWNELYLIDKVKNNKKAFGQKVIQISDEMGINPDWLMSLMHFETAGTMRADITNKYGYTGLIQFGKSAARSLGTSTANLRKMSNVKQLDFVKQYFTKVWRSRLKKVKNITDLYLIIIFPVAVGKSDDWIIQHRTVSKYAFWKANPAFRRGTKKYVTVGDIRAEIYKRYPKFNDQNILKPKPIVKPQITPIQIPQKKVIPQNPQSKQKSNQKKSNMNLMKIILGITILEAVGVPVISPLIKPNIPTASEALGQIIPERRNNTVECKKRGSFSTSQFQGTCSHHGGIKRSGQLNMF